MGNGRRRSLNSNTRRPKHYIGGQADAEPWMVGNEYIKHGYRINYNSTGKAILSVFQVHNETSNIWSHCLAALLSLWFVCYMTKFIAPPALSVEFGTNCTASEITFQKLHPDGSLIHSYYNHHIEEIQIVESTAKVCLDRFHCAQSVPSYLQQQVDRLKSKYHDVSYINQKLDYLQDISERLQSGSQVQIDQEVPRWPLFLMTLSHVVVFGISGTYHTMCCTDHKTLLFFRKMDFAGIVLGLMGSFIPPMYYGYFCQQVQWQFYLHMGTVYFCSILGLIAILSPSLIQGFGGNQLVAAILICAGYSSSPGFLWMWFGLDQKYLPTCPKWPFFIGGLTVAGGAVIYSLKFPERYFRGSFDFIGNSHNLFHCLTIIASLIWTYGCLQMYHERQLYLCPIESI